MPPGTTTTTALPTIGNAAATTAVFYARAARLAQDEEPGRANGEARGQRGFGGKEVEVLVNAKQKKAIRIAADWAARFPCVTGASIYGSVARGDETSTSDLDVDLEYVSDLTAPGMAVSYTKAQASFEDLCNELFREIGHRLRLSNYDKHRHDHRAREWIKCGTEIGSDRKVRMIRTSPKPKTE